MFPMDVDDDPKGIPPPPRPRGHHLCIIPTITIIQSPINFQTQTGGDLWPADQFETIRNKIKTYGKKWYIGR